MRSVNVYDLPTQKIKWANVNSQISRKLNKHKENEEVDLVLQVKNKYSQINFTHDDLPESLDDLLNLFPESVDLEFIIFEDGVSTEQGHLKKFEDVKDEVDLTKTDSPTESNKSNQSIKQDSQTKTDLDEKQKVIYSVDMNGIFKEFSTTLSQSFQQQNAKQEIPQRTDNSELVNALKSQIEDMKKSYEKQLETQDSKHEKQIEEIKKANEKEITNLTNLLKEEKEKANTANSQLFLLQIENTKLAMQASQNVNPQTVDARVEEAMRVFERNQKKMQEQLDEKKKEFDLLNMAVMEKRIQTQLKNNPENSELDKAVADVFRSKVPTIIDRGIDLMTSIPRNGKDITPTPII